MSNGQVGFALSTEEYLQILTTFSSQQYPIAAVSAEPGWEVVSSFSIPTTAQALLDLVGLVSDSSLTLTVRLYCVTSGREGEVLGSRISLTSTLDTEQISQLFTLQGGGTLYQLQAQVVGNSGDDYFGIVRRCFPVGVR
jgi:hypothetical protein